MRENHYILGNKIKRKGKKIHLATLGMTRSESARSQIQTNKTMFNYFTFSFFSSKHASTQALTSKNQKHFHPFSFPLSTVLVPNLVGHSLKLF